MRYAIPYTLHTRAKARDQPVNIPHRGARYIVYATYMPEAVGGVFAVMGDDFTLDFRV